MATAVPLTLVPIVASGVLAAQSYESWILQFSLLPWVLAAQLGIQTGVVALASAREATARELAAVSNRSVRVTAAAVAAGAVVVWLVLELLGVLGVLDELVDAFHDDPLTYLTIVAGALATAVAASQSALLLAVGAARFAAIASLVGAAAVAGALLAWRIAGSDDATAVPGVVLLGGGATTFALCRARMRTIASHDGPLDRAHVRTVQRSLVTHMGAQAVWVVPGLLISGIDNFLVAEFDAAALTPYSLGLVTATLGAGFVNALAVPLVALVASHVRPDGGLDGALGEPLAWATTRITIAAAAIVPATAAALVVLFELQDRSVTDETWVAIIVMSCGQSVRLMTAPLAAVAIAIGRQRALYASPIGEAATNVVCSVALGAAFGVAGVAVGTLIGAAVAVAVQTVAHRRSFHDTPFSRALWHRAVIAPGAASVGVAAVLCSVVVAS